MAISLRLDIFHDSLPTRSWEVLLERCAEELPGFPDLRVMAHPQGVDRTSRAPKTGGYEIQFRQSRRPFEGECFLMESREYSSQVGGIFTGMNYDLVSQKSRDRIENWKSRSFRWMGLRVGGSYRMETPLLFALAWAYACHVDGLIYLDYDQLDENVPRGIHEAEAFWRPTLALWTTRTAESVPWGILETGA